MRPVQPLQPSTTFFNPVTSKSLSGINLETAHPTDFTSPDLPSLYLKILFTVTDREALRRRRNDLHTSAARWPAQKKVEFINHLVSFITNLPEMSGYEIEKWLGTELLSNNKVEWGSIDQMLKIYFTEEDTKELSSNAFTTQKDWDNNLTRYLLEHNLRQVLNERLVAKITQGSLEDKIIAINNTYPIWTLLEHSQKEILESEASAIIIGNTGDSSTEFDYVTIEDINNAEQSIQADRSIITDTTQRKLPALYINLLCSKNVDKKWLNHILHDQSTNWPKSHKLAFIGKVSSFANKVRRESIRLPGFSFKNVFTMLRQIKFELEIGSRENAQPKELSDMTYRQGTAENENETSQEFKKGIELPEITHHQETAKIEDEINTENLLKFVEEQQKLRSENETYQEFEEGLRDKDELYNQLSDQNAALNKEQEIEQEIQNSLNRIEEILVTEENYRDDQRPPVEFETRTSVINRFINWFTGGSTQASPDAKALQQLLKELNANNVNGTTMDYPDRTPLMRIAGPQPFDISSIRQTPTSEQLRVKQAQLLEKARLLLDAGADVNAAAGGTSRSDQDGTEPGYTALMAAACTGSVAMMELLVLKGARVNANEGRNTALTYAMNAKHDVAIDYLLDQGAHDPEALSIAIRNRDVVTVRRLVENGVDVNAQNSYKTTAIIEAAALQPLNNEEDQANRLEIVAILIAAGADVNAKSENTSNKGVKKDVTALMVAAARDELEVMKLLIQAGANVNAVRNTDGSGVTALYRAVTRSSAQSIEYLLNHGANVGIGHLMLSDVPLSKHSAEETDKILNLLIDKARVENARINVAKSSSNLLLFTARNGFESTAKLIMELIREELTPHNGSSSKIVDDNRIRASHKNQLIAGLQTCLKKEQNTGTAQTLGGYITAIKTIEERTPASEEEAKKRNAKTLPTSSVEAATAENATNTHKEEQKNPGR